MATENIKVIKVDTGDAQRSTKELKAELKSLKDTMLSCEQGTDEYNKALQRAAEIQHTLKEQMEEINASAMDFGQITSNVVKATGGIVAGFQAAKATMNLFGIENETVLKSLEKMQNLMAITQAFPAIDSGVKAFGRLSTAIKTAAGATNGFKAALVSTGIGAAVVAIGLLVANFDKLKSAITGTNEELEKQKQLDIENDLKKTNDALEKRLNLEEKIRKAGGQDDLKIAQERVKTIELEISHQEVLAEKYMKQAAAKAVEKTNAIREGKAQSLVNALKEEELKLWEERDKYVRRADDLRKNALVTAKEELKTEKLLQAARDKKEKADAAEKAAAEARKQQTDAEKKRIEELTKLYHQLDVLIWDSTQKLKPQSLQEELEAKFRENPLTIPVKLEIDEEEELSFEDEAFFAKADELRKNVESVVSGLRSAFKTSEEQYIEEQRALDLWYYQDKLNRQEEYNRLSAALAKEHADNQKAIAVQEAQVWMSAIGNLGSVFASMADMVDTSTKEGEEKYKALMYTSTIVSMLAGIGGAIASAFMPVNAGMTIFGQIAMAASTSASVLASGIAQLVQIKNANKNSSLGGSFSSPSTSTVANLIAPVQYTSDVRGAEIEGAIRDSRVYVTETDITNTQNRVKVTENEARY